MESRGILPNNDKVKEHLRKQAMVAEVEEDFKHKEKEEDYTDVYLREQKNKYFEDVLKMGYPREDVIKLMNEGLYCADKFFLFEKLNGLK